MRHIFNFDSEIRFLAAEIPPEAAQYVSKIFSQLSEQLELKSRQYLEEKNARVAAIQHNRHIDVLIAMEIDKGSSQSEAISNLLRYEVDPEAVKYLWKFIKPRVDSAKRRELRKTVLRLKRHKLSNPQIAKRLGVSTRTIQRLLKA